MTWQRGEIGRGGGEKCQHHMFTKAEGEHRHWMNVDGAKGGKVGEGRGVK